MNMKKLLALLLAVIMVLSLAACGSSGDDEGGSKKEAGIVGQWKGTMDMSDALNDMLGGEGVEEYMDFDGIALDMVFTFKEDSTLTTEFDKDSVEKMADKLIDIMIDGALALYADMGMNLSDLGLTEESMREQIEASVDTDSMMESLDMDIGDYYLFDNDKIYIVDSKEDFETAKEESINYMDVELDGDTLTIKDIVQGGESMDEAMPGVLPIEMERR